MNQTFSAALNATRFGAAMAVVLYHLWPELVPSRPLPWPGHEAVVVFFVISGYVISYVTTGREGTFGAFAFSRMTRLYSVCVPAMLVGILSLLAVPQGGSDPSRFIEMSLPDAVIRSGVNLAFLGQNWRLDYLPPSNGPYWSLNYEAWYYVIFGAARFVPGPARWAVAGGLLLIAGPKIAVLLPCWLLGVALHRCAGRIRLGPSAAGLLLVACLAATAALFGMDASTAWRAAAGRVVPGWSGWLGASNKALSDTALAVLFTGILLAVGKLDWLEAITGPIRTPLKWLADRTFSIYLYHMPLFVLLWDGIGLRGWALVAAETAGLLALAQVTEMQLQVLRAGLRPVWQAAQGKPRHP